MANNVVFVDTGVSAPPPTLPPAVRGIKMFWETWEGTRYDLTDTSTGVYVLESGLEGLGFPEITNYEDSSPMLHGTTWAGWIARGRKVYWNVGVYHGDGGQAWVDRARTFLRSFRPGKTGRWIAEMPNGVRYALTLRYKGGLDRAHDVDPTRRGWHAYGIELGPEQPFWEGPEVEVPWDAGTDVDFYGPTGFGPDFFISSSQKMMDATVTNPGDVEAYAVWELRGPFRSASYGLGGRVTPVPFELLAGQSLVIDTNPRTGLTALLNGVDVIDRLPGFQYAPIPAGGAVPVSLAMDGAGTIRARFRPLYLEVI